MSQALPSSHLVVSPPSHVPLCDCALAHSVGRTLLHTLPQLAGKINNDSVVVIANVGVFVTKGNMFNVIKSGHGSWMFGTEAVYYMQRPWPTVFTAMTVERWRLITLNSNSCAQLVQKSPFLVKHYQPPWLEKVNGSKLENPNNTDIDIMMSVYAMEVNMLNTDNHKYKILFFLFCYKEVHHKKPANAQDL